MPKVKKGRKGKNAKKPKLEVKVKTRKRLDREMPAPMVWVKVKLDPDDWTFTYRDREKEMEADNDASDYQIPTVTEYVQSVWGKAVEDIKPKIDPPVKEESNDPDLNPDPENNELNLEGVEVKNDIQNDPPNKKQLDEHSRKKVHKEKTFECDICEKLFGDKSKLERHKDIHMLNRKTYPCDICKKEFKTKEGLKRHRNIHSSSRKLYECQICEKKFSQLGTLTRHIQAKHEGNKKQKCKFCDKELICSDFLFAHMRSEHFNLLRQQDKLTGDLHSIFQGIRTYECYRCKLSTGSATTIKKHMRICKGKKRPVIQTVKCELCTKRFSIKNSLKNHMQKVHSIHLSSEAMKNVPTEKTHKCSFCDKSFGFRVQLISHIRSDHFDLLREQDRSTGNLHELFQGIRTYECYLCKLASSKKSIKNHIRICNGERKVVIQTINCELCDTRFSRRDGLKTHMRKKHSINLSADAMKNVRVEKIHKCTFCSEMFQNRVQQVAHIRTKHFDLLRKQDKLTGDLHRLFQGIRTYECYQCKYSTHSFTSFKRHMKRCAQTKVKCKLCNTRFLSIKGVRDHLRRMHLVYEGKMKRAQLLKNADQLFECIDCKRHFLTIKNLITHMKLNCTKRVQCDYCFQRFSLQIDKDDHHRNVHPTLLESSHNGKFECHICKVCVPVHMATEHVVQIHQIRNIFECDICHAKFTDRNTLKKHKMKHGNGNILNLS